MFNPIQRLLSVLVVYAHNMKVLHWKVTGTDFDPTHSVFDEYAKKLNEFVDEVAEICIQLNTNPVSYSFALDVLEKDSLFKYFIADADRNYTSKEAFEAANVMFDTIIAVYEMVNKNQAIPEDIRNKLQEHSYFVRKEFMYKNKMRLT